MSVTLSTHKVAIWSVMKPMSTVFDKTSGFAGIFTSIDGAFVLAMVTEIPGLMFLELSETAFKIFLAQLGKKLEGGNKSLPSPSQKVVENYGHKNSVKKHLPKIS